MGKQKPEKKVASPKPVQVFKGIYFLLTGKKPKNIFSIIKKHGGTVFSKLVSIPVNFSKKIILLSYNVRNEPVTFKYLYSLGVGALILNYQFINDSIKNGKITFPIQEHFVHPRGELTLSFESIPSLVPQRASKYEDIPVPSPIHERAFFNKKFSIINYSERSFYDSWSLVLRSAGARVVNNRFERDVDYFLVQKEALLDHRSFGYAKEHRQVIITTCFIVDSLVLNKIVPLVDKNCVYHPPLNLSILNPIDTSKPKKMVATPVRLIPSMNTRLNEQPSGEVEGDSFMFQWTGQPIEVVEGVKYYYRFEMGSRRKRSFYCVRDVVEVKIKSSNRIVLGVITRCYEEWSGRRRIKYRTLCNRPEISKRKNELFLISFEDSAEVTEVCNHVDVYHYVCDESHGLYCTREYNPDNKQVRAIEDVIWNIPHRNANILFWLTKPTNQQLNKVMYGGISINGHQFFLGHIVAVKCVYGGRFCKLTGRISSMFESKGEKFLEMAVMTLDEKTKVWRDNQEESVKSIRFDNVQRMKSLMIVEDPISMCAQFNDEDDLIMKDEDDDEFFSADIN